MVIRIFFITISFCRYVFISPLCVSLLCRFATNREPWCHFLYSFSCLQPTERGLTQFYREKKLHMDPDWQQLKNKAQSINLYCSALIYLCG